MKNIYLFFSALFLFTSCGGPKSHSSLDRVNEDRIIQRYYNVRTSAPRSAFSAIDRIVEFEYNKNGQLIQRIVTGFAEGPLLAKTMISLESGDVLLTTDKFESKSYINNSSSTSSKPVSRVQIVNVPASTETVTQADGTCTVVTTPATTQTVNVTDYVDETTYSSTSQIYNELIYEISDETRKRILDSGTLLYTIFTERDSIMIKLYGRQISNIKYLLD